MSDILLYNTKKSFHNINYLFYWTVKMTLDLFNNPDPV